MPRITPGEPRILNLVDRLLPEGRTIARLGADLDADDTVNYFYHTLTQATGDDLAFARETDNARVTRIIDAAYALGVATGLHVNRAAFGPVTGGRR